MRARGVVSRVVFPICLSLWAAGCVIKSIAIESVPPSTAGLVTSPLKVHLLDGSTVIFADGARVLEGSVQGQGERYDAGLAPVGPVSAVPKDSVAAMETFRPYVRAAETTVLSLVGTAATAYGAAVLYVAIFGSCPTVYADSAGVPVLQAESFSYSIAPLFEARDVDRLRIQAPGGDLTLEVRNEALETHYINHLELLEAVHRSDEMVLPDATGKVLAVHGLIAPLLARDRTGHDRRTELQAPDGRVFRSDSALLARATRDDLEDWLDLAFVAPPGADSAALVLRLRNSLLTTVLFYDVILGPMGYRAADWMASGLGRIDAAVALGRWTQEQLGLRVEVFDGTAYRRAGRIGDVGPLATKDVALVLPTFGADTVRVRLRFAVDDWRIDRVALAAWRRVVPRSLSPVRITGADGRDDEAALTAVAGPDERYLETRPGQRFFVHFEAGPEPAHTARTFLLASQGYYLEWVRRSWLMARPATDTFVPGSDALYRAVARWREVQDTTERAFYATRVPVR